MKTLYLVKGLDCPVCTAKVEKGISEDRRVNKASLSFPDGRLAIESDTELSPKDIQAIVDPLEDGLKVVSFSHSEKKDEGKRFRNKIIILFIRIVLGLSLAIIGLTYVNEGNFGLWPNLAINAIAYLILGYDILYKAVMNPIKNHELFDENTLMAIASVGAFFLRFFGEASNEFFEAVMVVLLYQIGEVFENFAMRRSHQAVLNAVGLKAKRARRIEEDGSLEEVSPEDIRIGDKMLIRVGDLLPVDGSIIEGEGTLDGSSLTGEFLPVEVKEGSTVKAGTILTSGSIKMVAEKTYEDSSVAKILSLIEEGSEHKSKVDRFISKFAKWYTPAVMLISVLIMVIPPLFLGISDPLIWERWIYTGLCCLVISCPCAIVISVPLSFFAGIGLASKNNMVVRGSEYFDRLNKLKVLAVDKTGTLTEGKFEIGKVVSFKEEDALLDYLRASESLSSHPIADGILRGVDKAHLHERVTDYQEVAGKGISCRVDGRAVLSGSASFLAQHGVIVPDVVEEDTLVHLAVDGVYYGYITLVDKIRANSASMVKNLHKKGIKVILLTGDNEENAKKLAETLSLDGYHAGLTPEDKRNYIRELKEKYGVVGYVGDGINDAPSIIEADIGFSMGNKGSDLAIENSDILLMEDDPGRVNSMIDISHKATNKAISNIVIALLVKVVVMVLSIAIEDFPLYVAVFADTGILALLILNALSLLLVKIRKEN